MITVSVKNASTTTRTHAPMVGIHLPMENERMAAHTANQMNPRAKMYLPAPLRGVKNSPKVATAVIVSEPPSQIGLVRGAAEADRVRQPVEHRADRRGEAPERELDPHVRAALLGEARPELRRE